MTVGVLVFLFFFFEGGEEGDFLWGGISTPLHVTCHVPEGKENLGNLAPS